VTLPICNREISSSHLVHQTDCPQFGLCDLAEFIQIVPLYWVCHNVHPYELVTKHVTFEVITAVNMKNVVFCDIRTQYIPHRRHITSPLQSPACYCYERFEVFTAVTMKNAVFSDIKSQFVLHRRHITSSLQSPACYCYVRFEVFKA
jgi:hypothetical protein